MKNNACSKAIGPFHVLLLGALFPLSIFPPTLNAASRVERSTAARAQPFSTRPAVGTLSNIARQVSVRIFSNSGMGSGVIIKHWGQTYTILTCTHVVADNRDNRYGILTIDGRMHAGRRLRSIRFPNADVSLVQFSSNRAYRAAEIADSRSLAVSDPVYASGFPNWHWINSNAIEETRNWGTRAFRLTSGKVAMLPKKSLQQGYQLGYTNEIEQGMSGGPVLDRYGRLIGINGRLKHPLQDNIAFIFADGTIPSEEIFQQMAALSWAVPSSRFRQVLK